MTINFEMKPLAKFLFLLLTHCCLLSIAQPQPGTHDLTFNPMDAGFGGGDGMNSDAGIHVVRPDGKIIVIGSFMAYNATSRNFIARVNADGTVDQAFNPGSGPNDAVMALALQPDGKIIIGGAFPAYNGIAKKYLARLNADGSLDESFNTGTGPSSWVQNVIVLPDGKIMVAGYFESYNGTPASRIVRLNADGTVDATFSGVTGGPLGTYINRMVPQPDGKILIAGNFTAYNGQPIKYIARLNADGSLDSGFDPGTGADNPIYTVLLQPDGKIIVGGSFTTYNGTGRNRIARLNADGSLDPDFDPGAGANTSAVSFATLQPDGKIIISGGFTSYNGVARNYIARINAGGSLDETFNPGAGPNSSIAYVSLLPDEKIIITGIFTSYDGTIRHRIARLHPDGTSDTSFNVSTGANNMIRAVAVQPDRKIIIGGQFTLFNGVEKKYIARLTRHGNLDATFNTGSGPGSTSTVSVSAIVLQSDGKILIGGRFTSYNGTPANNIARLNTDGTLDVSFNPGGSGASSPVDAMILQADGKILIGGQFSSYNGTPRNRIARLNDNGSLDVTFNPNQGPNNSVSSVAVQSADGKIIIGGSFTRYNGTDRNRIARLNADGTLDTSFDPGAGLSGPLSFSPAFVYSIAFQSDGKILIGGRFNFYNGVSRNGIARLNDDGSLDDTFDVGTGTNEAVNAIALHQNDKILVGGNFTSYNGSARKGIMRLNMDGSVDEAFDPGTGANGVQAYSILPNGQIILGGSFTAYNGTGRNRIARINGDVIVEDQTISFSPLPAVTYGDAAFELTAATDAELPVTYTSSNPDVASVSGTTVTILSAGTALITASQPGNDAVNEAPAVEQELTVNKASLTTTADNKSKTYGDANPGLTITYNGFKGTDDASIIDVPPLINTTASQFSDAGTYPISLSGGNDNNYNIIITDGTLTVNKAPLSAKADDKIRIYGDSNPTFTITWDGFKGADDASSIDTQPTIITTAGQYDNTGIYPISISGGTDNNYELTLADGTLTVNKAELSVVANDKTKLYGDANPLLSITYNGLKGTDDAFSIDAPPTINTTATQFSDVGTYPISLSGGNDNNYDITDMTDGTLTINKAILSATSDNKTKTYGDPNPVLTISYNGFKGMDDISSIDIPPAVSTSVSQFEHAGTYPILLSGGSDVNYDITHVSGTLTIQKATLTATAVEVIRTYGDENPPFTITYSGFIGTDDISVIDTPPTAGTTATRFSNAGIHWISLSGGSDDNYSFTFVSGMLVVRRAELSVTVADVTRTYGDPNPLFTATYEGFKGTDDISVVTPVTINTTATQFSDAGEYLIIGTGGHADNYDISILTGYLTINKAPLSVTVENKSRTYGEVNPALTFTYSGFRGTDNISSIDTPPMIYTTAIQYSDAGEYPISLEGGNDNNYEFVVSEGVLTISKASVAVTVDNKTKTYGDANPPLTITYDGFKIWDDDSAIDTPPTVVTTATQFSNVGAYPISLSGGDDNNYTFTIMASGILTVTKAALSAKADDKTKKYGDPNPALTITYDGFKGSDNASSIDMQPAISTTAVQLSDAGTYPISLSGGSDSNYDITLVNGTLAVNKAPLAVTVHDAEKIYGEPMPPFTITYSGFVAGDDESDIDTPPIPVTAATVLSDAGEYDITLSGGGDNNYTMVSNSGTLTISKAQLTVRADDQARNYGENNPAFTMTYSGFVNGDDTSDIDTSPTSSTLATVLSDAGEYDIMLSGGADNNYTMVTEAGKLTIDKAQLTARAHDQTRNYGEANPLFTINYTGFVNGDDESDLDTPPTASTTATITSDAGEYDIEVSGGTDNNYNIVAIKGKLVIGKISQTISFETVPDKLVSAPDFSLVAIASSGLAVQFSTTSDKVSLNGNQVTIHKAGRVSIQADQPGNDSYSAADRVVNSFCIKPLPPEISLDLLNPAAPVLTSSSDNGNQWYLNGIGIEGATGKTHVISTTGSYQVTTAVDDCASNLSAATAFIVTSNEETVKQLNEATAFPNPAEQSLFLRLSGFDPASKVIINLTDAFGRIVGTLEAGEKEVEVLIGHYAPGMYTVQMVQGTKSQQIRIVKK